MEVDEDYGTETTDILDDLLQGNDTTGFRMDGDSEDHYPVHVDRELSPCPFTWNNDDLATMKSELDTAFDMDQSQEDLDAHMRKIPKIRAQIKMDVLKKKLCTLQRTLAWQHAQKVRAGAETYTMNNSLRQRYLNSEEYDGSSTLDVTNEDLIHQFTASSYTLPFLLNIEEVMDDAIQNRNMPEQLKKGLPTPHTPLSRPARIIRTENPTRPRHKLLVRPVRRIQQAVSTTLPHNSHRIPRSSQNQSKPLGDPDPVPTRFSFTQFNSSEDEFTPKMGNSSQPSARVNALSPLITATKSKVVAGNGLRLKLYTQSPVSVSEMAAATLKRFGTTITPANPPELLECVENTKMQKAPENKVIKVKPSQETKVIHITPAMAASMTGLTRPKPKATKLSSVQNNFNGKPTRPINKINAKILPNLPKYTSRLVFRKKPDGTAKIIRKYNPVQNCQPKEVSHNISTTLNSNNSRTLPISFLPQMKSAISRIRQNSPAKSNASSDFEDPVPVITSVMSEAPWNPVILLNPIGSTTLTPVPVPTTTSPIKTVGATVSSSPQSPGAKRRYEELLHGHKPIRPKPPDNTNSPIAPVTGTIISATPNDPLAWNPSISVSVSVSSTPIVTQNVPLILPTSASGLNVMNGSTGQSILINSNVLVLPPTLPLTFSTNTSSTMSTVTPIVSETPYDSNSNPTTPSNSNDADHLDIVETDTNTTDENEILGL